MRKRLWILHSWLGLFAGLVLLVVGASGSLLVFRAEIETLLSPPRERPAIALGASRLGLDELFTRIRAQLPEEEIIGWMTARDPLGFDEVNLQPRAEPEPNARWILADPYSGEVFADTNTRGRKFIDWLYDLHIHLLGNSWATALNGCFAVVLCLLGISGVWLYREFWRNFIRLRWRASARIFFSDLHKTVGISSVIFNLILGFTGAWWNLQIVPQLFAADTAEPTSTSTPARLYNPALMPDALVAAARHAMPELRTDHVLLGFPPYEEDAISVHGELPTRNPFRNHFAGQVIFDRETGAVTALKDIRRAPLWEQIEDTFMPLHFGTFGGLPIKILWCAGGLTPGVLAISGTLIWWSRRHPARSRPLPL